jgi:hypothetical protein
MEQIDITHLGLVATMMDEDQYWQLIADSLENSTNESEQQAFLIAELSKLSPEEMIGFRLRTDKLLYDTYTSEMWCAGYIMNSGCSDDGFEYFRNWVISRGKETYYQGKENPDSLHAEAEADKYDYDFESFWYVALEAFHQRTGKDLYDYIDYEKFTTRESNYPNFEFNWESDEPETMRAICPKLFEKMWITE